ncbi:MAG: guanylate kinase [Clostridiales bacterium]|nr:guanylate kinase [Clostridiales bacterium]
MTKGRLFTVSGPAGVGKGTIVKMAIEKDPTLFLSVSCTTREIRADEVAGVTYHYISDEEFDRMVSEDAFFEWANVHGRRYGTPRPPVDEAVAAGRNAILEIDVQGSAQIVLKQPETIRIFILPPDWESLYQRIVDRGRDSMEDIKKRMRNALGEVKESLNCDYVLTNYTREETRDNFLRILGGEDAKEFSIEAQRENILNLINTYHEPE